MSEQIEELIAGYVLKTISPEEVEELERYLLKNPELRKDISQFEEVMAAIAHTSPRVSAPPRLRDSILQAAEKSVERKKILYFSSWRWQKIAIAALTFFALVLGWENYQLRQQIASVRSNFVALQGDENLLFAFKGTSNAPSASGSVLLDLAAGKALVALQNLPPLSKGKFYQLWAISENKKIPCGKVNSNSLGRVVERIPIPIEEYTDPVSSMLITIESSPNPLYPSDAVVMLSIAS